MNTSKTIDTLRRNLYQRYDYDIPETSLYMNVDKVKQKERIMPLAHNQTICEISAQSNFQVVTMGKVDPEIYKIIDSLSDIGLLITVLTKKNIKHTDIDECLEAAYKIYELPKIIDFLLSICVDVLLQMDIDLTDFK